MKLTTRSRYGTRMMLDMARYGKDGPVRIKDIATRQGVSVKYLEKLVRELKQAGFVKSRRGPRGGHELAKPALDEATAEKIIDQLLAARNPLMYVGGGVMLADCMREMRELASSSSRCIWLNERSRKPISSSCVTGNGVS